MRMPLTNIHVMWFPRIALSPERIRKGRRFAAWMFGACALLNSLACAWSFYRGNEWGQVEQGALAVCFAIACAVNARRARA